MSDTVKRWSLGLYAPGNYHCICSGCSKQFVGDKRAIQCLPCAAEKAAARIAQLEAALKMFACACADEHLCSVPDNCRNFLARAALGEDRT